MKKKIILALVCTAIAFTGCGLLQNKQSKILKLQASSSQVASGTMVTPWLYTSVTNFSYRNLFISDTRTDETVPDLVDTYSVSPDGLIYEMTLKKDLLWSDGEELNLEDVIFSFESILVTEQVNDLFKYAFASIVGANAYASGAADSIEGINVEGDVLTIQLEKPMRTFIPILGQFAILPAHCFQDEDVVKIHESAFWSNPVVSGIYKIGEKVENEYLTYVYNENYGKTEPNIETLMLRADYELAEIDYTTTSNVSQILSLRAMSFMQEHDVTVEFYRYMLFNMNQNGAEETAVDDVRVRTAIIQAIDFESILTEVYYNSQLTSELESKSYDVERAKALLEEAEHDFDRPLVLLTPFVDADTTLLMEKMAGCLEKVGFEVEIKMGGNLYTDVYDVGVNDLSAIGKFQWYTEYGDTHDLRKYVFGDCTEFDVLIDELEATTTNEEYQITLQNLNEKSMEKVYKFPIITMNHKAYTNKDRVEVPDDLVFGNARYKFDLNLPNWDIKG